MLCVIGAGLPRTATSSLREALPVLLGGKCYHMKSVFDTPQHADVWASALDGKTPDWHELFDGHTAAVDWPASAMWPQLSSAFPEAVILLSKRSSGAAWYRSMSDTILKVQAEVPTEADDAFAKMFGGLWRRIIRSEAKDEATCVAAYDRYLQEVRDTAPADRLVEWDASQGWEPICAALGVDVPDEPFPHVNSTAEFQQMATEAIAARSPHPFRESSQSSGLKRTPLWVKSGDSMGWCQRYEVLRRS